MMNLKILKELKPVHIATGKTCFLRNSCRKPRVHLVVPTFINHKKKTK